MVTIMVIIMIMLILFLLLSKTQNYTLLLSLQKLSKIYSKGFERSIYWNGYKTKSENENTTNTCRYFLKSKFVGVNRLSVLVFLNQDANSKRFKTRRYYLPKDIIRNYNVIINGKKFCDQAIDSDIKQYEEIGKLITGQGEDYTTGCLKDYDYIKSHYRLIAVDLSRQKVLDADPKAIQQMEFVGQLQNPEDEVAANESMFVLTILEKNKEKKLKFSQGSATVL